MKNRINITLCCCLCFAQLSFSQWSYPEKERGLKIIKGKVVSSDMDAPRKTSRADMIIKIEEGQKVKYIRLIYAASGFGFDAPPALEDQLLPAEMFNKCDDVWVFKVRHPKTKGEVAFSSTPNRVIRYQGDGSSVQVFRVKPIPGYENEAIPCLESLPCMIIYSWSKCTASIDKKKRGN